MNANGFSSPSGSPVTEGPALKEEQSKGGSGFDREGGGYEHEGEEGKSDGQLPKQANEITDEDDDDWFGALGAFANRQSKRTR